VVAHTVTRFDLNWIEANRDQLWAEAKHRVRHMQESIRLPEDLWPHAAQEQAKRTEVNPWEDIIRGAVSGVTADHLGVRRIATDDVWTALGIPVDRRDTQGARTIGQIMQKLGLKNKPVRQGDEVKRGYVGVLIGDEEADGEASPNAAALAALRDLEY
jgi:hypothetical protein